jgi:SAM-dependent methyltransferase
MAGPTKEFWQERFEANETGWDRGHSSPQLLTWLESDDLRPCRIAGPGCGSGWEVAELAKRGFEVVAIDYTPAAVERTNARLLSLGLNAEVIQADVLTYQPDSPFDAIYEQTCLCALHPDHWFKYASQLRGWLKPEGQLWAMFMQMLRAPAIEQGLIVGPPYHCDINAMRALFMEANWVWPKPPYAKVMHPIGAHELGLRLVVR